MFTNQTTSAASAVLDAAPLRKFMFDRAFDDAQAGQRVPERKPITLKPEQYDALQKESYDSGFAAGHKAGVDEQSRQLIAAVQRLDERIGHMIQNMEALRAEQDLKMRELVVAITRKMLPGFTAKFGMEEIQVMLNNVIADMAHEPRLVVRVHASQFDALNEKINDFTQKKAYAGKVVLLSDDNIVSGDCRVEWADGGIERKAEATLNDIAQAVLPEMN